MRPVSEAILDNRPPLPAKGCMKEFVYPSVAVKLVARSLPVNTQAPEDFIAHFAVVPQNRFGLRPGSAGRSASLSSIRGAFRIYVHYSPFIIRITLSFVIR